MSTALRVEANPDLDYLLAQVAESLQLTRSQVELMTQNYESVSDWLAAPGSPLARWRPRIYPQGSVAIQTTVRPLERDEYDLDFVCELQPSGRPALMVYDEIYARLAAHGVYGPLLEKKKRCVRIDYARNFHLDIIPAEPDTKLGGTHVVVPDREMKGWTPSNPKGYAAWFTQRAAFGLAEMRKAQPLPAPVPVDEKPTLAIVVQLMKRRRDILFAGADSAPRSILLTTLAGEHYRGSACVATSLRDIAAGIRQRMVAAAPERITVPNPANPGEQFCESLDDDGRYEALGRYVRQLEHDADTMLATAGIPQLNTLLGSLFGEEPVNKAMRAYGELLKSQRDAGALKYATAGAGGLGIVPNSPHVSRVAPPNRNFGGDE
jgi:hypothetical protein